ncbi:MAG: YHS domain-containing protein [Ignavibacteria bacterium]|nr:YHS domain-containing protein [Ignavibacteria bacterium]
MKTLLALSSIIIALFIFNSNSFSQSDDCCKEKSASCCTESKDCCIELGNAGGDSSVAGMTCPVSGEAIGDGQGVKFDYYGKTYTFCCEGCEAKFRKEPMNYIKEEMKCPVMGEVIESKDVFVVNNGTKYYFCCKSCIKKFENDPDKYRNGYKD